MKLVETIKDILLLEYSKKLVGDLIKKFREESHFSDLNDDMYLFYIDRFNQIKNSPKVIQKDITKYRWEELQKIVDEHRSDRIKAGTINDGKPTNSDLVYNDRGLRIYKANSLKACVKYGNGYNFCISSRGKENRFDDYSVDNVFGEGTGVPYFIFDDTKTSERNVGYDYDEENSMFEDPTHILVLHKYKHYYKVTTANNDDTTDYFNYRDVEKSFPRLRGLEKVFKWEKPPEYESKLSKVTAEFKTALKLETDAFEPILDESQYIFKWYGWDDNLKYVNDLLRGKKKLIFSLPYENVGGTEKPVMMGEFFIIDPDEVATIRARAENKFRIDHLNYANRLIHLKLFEIDTTTPSLYHSYLTKVSRIYQRYNYQMTKIKMEYR